MTRPLLAVDVDGVISLFGFDEPPPGSSRALRARRRRWSTASRSAPASGCCGSASTSTWSGRPAGRRKPTTTCRTSSASPSSRYLTFGGAARFGSAHWKLGPLDEYGSGRALAWIDDSFDESCYEWAQDREEPTLLVPTESALGLEEAQTEALIAWAKGSRLTRVSGFWPIFFLLVVLKIPVLGVALAGLVGEPGPGARDGGARTPAAAPSAGAPAPQAARPTQPASRRRGEAADPHPSGGTCERPQGAGCDGWVRNPRPARPRQAG